jgi:hypothetical protein
MRAPVETIRLVHHLRAEGSNDRRSRPFSQLEHAPFLTDRGDSRLAARVDHANLADGTLDIKPGSAAIMAPLVPR